ncbi:MAG: 30S ribosomal protein S4 [Deltaproteobacteria bacterium]|nr:MAG: 30S ribosomal protein S4 [Deltaproteobacteria bacterium]
MARYTEARCRLCRRAGAKLFLKGQRCLSSKCPIEGKRKHPPGQHGHRRIKPTDYGIQLREKQKVRQMYGLLERQFRNYFEKAERMKGVTGENLLLLLERRLDNVVYRLGFAASRSHARQLVRHNHFLVNGKKVNIPSYLVKVEDVITLREKSRKIRAIQESLEFALQQGIPEWLHLNHEEMTGKVAELPSRDQLNRDINEQLIVELYSR